MTNRIGHYQGSCNFIKSCTATSLKGKYETFEDMMVDCSERQSKRPRLYSIDTCSKNYHGNEEERKTLMKILQYFYREDLSEPHGDITAETLS